MVIGAEGERRPRALAALSRCPRSLANFAGRGVQWRCDRPPIADLCAHTHAYVTDAKLGSSLQPCGALNIPRRNPAWGPKRLCRKRHRPSAPQKRTSPGESQTGRADAEHRARLRAYDGRDSGLLPVRRCRGGARDGVLGRRQRDVERPLHGVGPVRRRLRSGGRYPLGSGSGPWQRSLSDRGRSS